MQKFAIHNKSNFDMSEVSDNSVDLIVTSPPYNIGKSYEKDLTMVEYEDFLSKTFKECDRVLKIGGRIAINFNDTGGSPLIRITNVIDRIATKLNWLDRGTIIWNKSNGVNAGHAWGSYLSPSNPVLRHAHEWIYVYSKGSFKRSDRSGLSDIKKEQFAEYTKTIWNMSPESGKRIGHPAPFPVELPKRLIMLYTWPGDIVLDPFCGSGTTGVAAAQLGREFIGYELIDEYCELSKRRIGSVNNLLQNTEEK